MHHAAILLHTLPDGSSHFDWLIDQPTLDIAHRLIAFRCEARADEGCQSGFIARRLPDHRARYLTYEGPISGDRGHVAQVALGSVHGFEMGEDSMDLTIEWAQFTVRYRGRLDTKAGDIWIFQRDACDSSLDG